MKKFKILISSFVVITLLCVSCFSFASSMVSDAASGMGKTISNAASGTGKVLSDMGNTISNAASDAGKTVSEGMNNIKDGAMEARDNMINATDSLTNDIKDGIDRNSTTNNTTTNTTNNETRNVTNYTTTPVAYNNDNVSFLGMTMSRTSLILLVTALAAIIIAILVYSYVKQDNDKYRNDDI